MDHRSVINTDGQAPSFAKRQGVLLRLIRAAKPITRADLALRLGVNKSVVAEHLRPLTSAGIIREAVHDGTATGRRTRAISFSDGQDYFIGLNLGVRSSQVGVATLDGEISEEIDFETPSSADLALRMARDRIHEICKNNSGRRLRTIGVSVPGMIDPSGRDLIFAPNLGWKNVKIADSLAIDPQVKVVVENASTAAALYEARVRIGQGEHPSTTNFILVRSGTGIGVGLVIGGEVFRGGGIGTGIAGEFGHMTIVAGGKPCVCGNRGCWEKYASAASAASLYLGDRPPARGESVPRFVEIVSKAENGDNRSRRTLEKIGDHLGIGIANVIMGMGIVRVIISGRLVHGWKFIKQPMNEAIRRSIIGNVAGWSVEAGEPVGSAIGGALEVAVEEFLSAV